WMAYSRSIRWRQYVISAITKLMPSPVGPAPVCRWKPSGNGQVASKRLQATAKITTFRNLDYGALPPQILPARGRNSYGAMSGNGPPALTRPIRALPPSREHWANTTVNLWPINGYCAAVVV